MEHRTRKERSSKRRCSAIALAIRKQIGDLSGQGTSLNNIGAVYNDLGQYSKALELLNQALAIRKQIGDISGQENSLNNIGGVYTNLGKYSKASALRQTMLKTMEKHPDPKNWAAFTLIGKSD